MHKLPWLDHLPDDNVQGGIDRANRLYWNITWHAHEARWFVYAGEDLIYTSDARESTEAFLYGLGLAYAVLPDDLFDRLEYGIKRLVAPEDVTRAERDRFGEDSA